MNFPVLASSEINNKTVMNKLILLVLALGISGCSSVKTSTNSAVKTTHLKLMTYNIRIGKGGGEWNNDPKRVDLKPIAKLIEKEKPDLVGLEEVDRFRQRTALLNQPEKLSQRLNMHVAFQPAYTVPISGGASEEYGIALLSRFPIQSSERFGLFKPDYLKSHPQYPDYFSEQRALLHSEIAIGAQTVHVFVTHLGLTPDQREKQIEQIAETVAKVRGPKILLGDFNAEPTEPALEKLRANFTDVLSATGKTLAERKSYPVGEKSTEAIDYIFVSKEFRVLSAKVLRDSTLASDHNPVVAEVELRR